MNARKLPSITASTAMLSLDLVCIAVGWPFAMAAAGLRSAEPDRLAMTLALCYPAAIITLHYALGQYRRESVLEPRKALSRTPISVSLAGLGVTILAIAVAHALPPYFPSLLVAASFCFMLCALAARVAFKLLTRTRLLRRHVIVLGAGQRAWDLVYMLRREGRDPNYDVTFIHDDSLDTIDPRLQENPQNRIIRASNHSLLDIARDIHADQIVVAPDDRRGMRLEALLECKKAGYPVLEYLSFVEREIRRIDLKRMDLSWVLYSGGFSFSVIDRSLKRLFDMAASTIILALASPFLLGAIFAIKFDDGGPVFYFQDRVTRDGRVFRIAKLRTMRIDAEATGAVWARKHDDRITYIGAWLRRTRLDEIPQLLNVLRGDMSLVGPRPERPGFIEVLTKQIPLYNERHMVKAGLTGWAQVNYPYGASIDDARSKLSYDLYYVKNFSVLFDFLILLQTLRVVLWPSGTR